MKHKQRFAFFIFLYLLIVYAGAGAAQFPVINYPESLIEKLGITPQDIVKNQEKFRTNRTHREWMSHVHEVIPGLDPEKKEAIGKLHTAMLYLKDKINTEYLSGSINQQEFTAESAQLMKWFLNAHQSMLSKKEYESLFQMAASDEPSSPVPAENGLGFPIENPETTVEMIKKEFDEPTINKLAHFYGQHSQELRDIRKIYETGDANAKPEQIKNDMQRIEKELQTAYMRFCRKTLTDKQFRMIFGSPGEEK